MLATRFRPSYRPNRLKRRARRFMTSAIPDNSNPSMVSYDDRVSEYDTHNRVLYIYYLGCFNNTPIYHYGEANDLMSAELRVKMTLPLYERVWHSPVSHRVNAKAELDDLVSTKRVEIALPNVTHWDAFTTDNISLVVSRLDAAFKVL